MNIQAKCQQTIDMLEERLELPVQEQECPSGGMGIDASESIIEALENETTLLFNNSLLKDAMLNVFGGCPPEVRRSIIDNAGQYGLSEDNALYGWAVFDLFNTYLEPKGAIFINPVEPDQNDVIFGHGGYFFNRSKLNSLPLIVTDDITLAFKTTYPVYLSDARISTKSTIISDLLKVHSKLYFIAPIHLKDDIQRRFTDINVNLAFIPEPSSVDMPQDVLDEMINEAIQKASVQPNGHLAKPFVMDNNTFLNILTGGLYQIREKQDENGEIQQTRTFISPPLTILGEARNIKNNDWKRVIQFYDKDNTQHTLLIPYEHFMGEAQDALKLIANHGLMPPRQSYKKNIFIQYIQDYPIEKRFRCVDRAGWHGTAFVTPNKTYGYNENEDLLFHSENPNLYKVSGVFSEWQQLSRLIEPHDLGVLVFSSAFSGQLVTPMNAESGGFHIYGSSTDGKSTITKAACSIWGNPKDISKSWRTTDNALENEAELRNDNFLNLDELRQATPKAVSDIVYMLTGGQGKARSSKAGKNKDAKQFSLIYTSTGEVTLEEHLRRGNIELDAGLLLRFTHLSSDSNKGFGVFDCINYGSSAQDVGNRINELASQHYGHAGQQWLEYLTQDFSNTIELANSLFNSFIQQFNHLQNGQANRVLRRFALVAVAGELATQANITGWQKGRAFHAVGQCFKKWMANLGNGKNLEETKILQHIKAFFEAHGTSRFENLTTFRKPNGDVVQPHIHNRVGYYDPDQKVFLVSNTMFGKEMCIGISESNAKKVLKANNWLDCEDGRFTKRIGGKLPDGSRPSMMHFKIEAIQHFDVQT